MNSLYQRPTIPEKDLFMANRIKRWILKPDSDPELTSDVKAEKYPELELFLDELN
jgi:hypothetical protein